MRKLILITLLLGASLTSYADNRGLRIGVVGGGPAGLTAAFRLKSEGFTNVVVLERNSEVGGKTQTIEENGRTYEMGAIMSGPSYEEVIKLAKEFGENIVPFAKGGEPLVLATPSGSHESTMSLGKKMSLLAAAVEYHFIYNKYRSAFDQPGMSKVPDELNEPFATWVKKNSSFPSQMQELLSHSFVSFGYGHMSEVPAAYVLRYFSPKLLRSFMFGQVHMIENGYQSLWKKVAASVSVKTDFEVEKAIREDGVWSLRSRAGDEQKFDALIWTAPLEDLAKRADISPSLKDLFSKIRYQNYYSTLVEIEGLSRGGGVITKNYEVNAGGGNIVSWLNRWPQESNLTNFYTLSNETLSPDAVEAQIRSFAKNHGFTIRRIVKNVGWHYFPHFDQEALEAKAYDLIESSQGQNGLYLAGELMNFSTVEHTAEYSKELVERFFIRQGKLSAVVPGNYSDLKKSEKLQWLWSKIVESEYKVPPTYKQLKTSLGKELMGFLPSRLSKAFSNNNDVIEKGRTKIIHKLGSTATVRFEALDENYQNFDGLIRLSNAVDGADGTMYPSFSMKIPMDGADRSINFNIGKSFDGQRIENDFRNGKPDFNFFRDDKTYPFSNELPLEPRSTFGKAFKWVFDQAHLAPNYISVSELSKVMNKPAPRRFVFRAPPELRALMPSDHYTDERQVFSTIEAGSVLFEVYESTGLGDPGKLVGHLRTTSRFVSSQFGDQNLYFRHEGRAVKNPQQEFSKPFEKAVSCARSQSK